MARRSCHSWQALGIVLLVLVASAPVAAATLAAGFGEVQIAGGIASPTAMAFAPDGRLFVAEQGGKLRVIKNGALLPTPFVDLSAVVDLQGERGLLGVAFDPGFVTNQWVYVYFTVRAAPVHNRVVRYTANGDVAVPGSDVLILRLDDLSAATNHNGGAMHFGADGKLYVAVGENATPSNAQTLANRLGKMLRTNADGSIPADNPFFTAATGANRAIWALGLRNPFTFAFQPGTGRMFINDVGQDTWEEINDGVAGANYGWPTTEGPTSNPSFRSPLFAYQHGFTATTGCAITGGAFYNPPSTQFPADYVGDYFFADYCSGWIRRYDPVANSVTGFATGIAQPVDLNVGTDGSLYYLAIGDGATTGAVFKISFTDSQAPSITTHPASQSVPAGNPVTFTVAASGTAPLSYQWQRNGANIAGATSTSYTIASVSTADNGAAFRAVVTNSFDTATSNAVILTVTAPNTAPTATITAPANGTLYSGGATINYAGTANDAEDGSLPGSAFTWQVDLHHDTHTHPFMPPTSGSASGSFVIPTAGHTETNVFYRIQLTVWDSGGLTSSTFVDLVPRKVTLTLATNPSGLQVTVDGQPQTAPVAFASVVGIVRGIGGVSPQTAGSTTYQFTSWSDGGAAQHSISTPAANTTYTASFQEVPRSANLVAAYGFEQGSGPAVADTSGHGLTGTIFGATWTTAGKFGSTLSFDGANDSIVVPASSLLNLTTGMTLMAWVFPTAHGPGVWRNVIIKERPAGEVYNLYSNVDTDEPTVYVVPSSSRPSDVRGTSQLPLNVWTHLAATYDGATLRLYVNGTEVGSRALPGPLLTSDGDLRIGGNGVWGEFFQGLIDEVRIYNRALTTAEISSDMSIPVGSSPPPAPTDLVAAYSFDEGSGTTVTDASGTGHTGAISGATWTTAGRFGNALTFDGVSDWVTIADSNLLDLTTGMTLMAWVYPTVHGSGIWRNVIIKERSNGEVYNLYSNVDTDRPTVYIVRSTSPPAPTDVRGSTQPPLNTWTHLAATYDGALLHLYVNGLQVGVRSLPGALLTSNGPLRIGGNGVWGEFFSGRIDDVRVYNRALAASEIQSDMNTPVGTGATTSTTPSASSASLASRTAGVACTLSPSVTGMATVPGKLAGGGAMSPSGAAPTNTFASGDLLVGTTPWVVSGSLASKRALAMMLRESRVLSLCCSP